MDRSMLKLVLLIIFASGCVLALGYLSAVNRTAMIIVIIYFVLWGILYVYFTETA